HLIFKGLILPPFLTTTQNQSVTTGEKINWLFSEGEGLKQAKIEGKVAMIDFWASWCAACMEFEKITYADPAVIDELKRFVNIKIDCTNTNDPDTKRLWSKYGIVGLPTIVFIGKDGNIVKDKTITGFVNAEEFLSILKNL
ncbi:MAG TPA: thioredoxin fold domain-containing protein, partial [Candidatus Wunengus sp. YC63]|uniref:thioredoxin fold domain-containing protein n=1 Tax=Candidatus Wunengus sp. YC63 TaxID=3367699 RepID=UPI004025FF3D